MKGRKAATVTELKKPRTPARKRTPAQKRRAWRDRARGATAAGMPLFALSATVQAGHLASHDASVAALAVGGIAAGVYATSLPHVALGLRRACHVPTWQSWSMALAIDGAVVAGEVARLAGGIEPLAWAMMAAGVAMSATFNVIGFARD